MANAVAENLLRAPNPGNPKYAPEGEGRKLMNDFNGAAIRSSLSIVD